MIIRYAIFVVLAVLSTFNVVSNIAFSKSNTNSKKHVAKDTRKSLDRINSPKEFLRKKIFAEQLFVPACNGYRFLHKDGSKSFDVDLDSFLRTIAKYLKEQNIRGLMPLFHPRTKVTRSALREVFASFKIIYKAPFDVSVFRVWALNTVDGSTKWLSCSDKEVSIYPLYGYPLQFSTWFQLMGQNELARINIAIVPVKTVRGADEF